MRFNILLSLALIGVTTQLSLPSAIRAEQTIAALCSGCSCESFESTTSPWERVGCRDKLTGDWLGARSTLADRGVDFDLFATQFYQAVASGGREQEAEYGGKLDYFLSVEGGKLCGSAGLFVDLHAETRFGNSVNNIDGLLTPANIAMSFPDSDASVTSITGLKVTQALSENFALYAGKINTLDEYPISYNGGAGLGGFMNTSLVFNPIMARTVPYSAAGAGMALLSQGAPWFALTVFDPEERATKGLENLYERGVVIVPDVTLRVNPLGRPGVYNFGGSYSTAKYTSVDPAAYLSLPQFAGVFPQETGSWSAYANFYQALWVDACDTERTWGLFGQFGISDGNPNPIRFVANGGVGGRSMIHGRALDTFGVGYFYIGLSDNFKALAAPLLPQQDEHGVELFYNYAIAPWCRLTGDLQVARPSTIGFDTAIIAGLRLQMIF